MLACVDTMLYVCDGVERAAAVFVGSSSTIKVVLGHARAVNKKTGISVR